MKKLKKGMSFHTEDNTVLSCPAASYKYNYGTYRRFKIGLIVFSIIGIIVSLLFVFLSNDVRVQTLFATLIGGLLSIIVWAATSFVSDRIKQEQDEIDKLILAVDKHIDYLHTDMYFVNSSTYTIKAANKNDGWTKFIWQLQLFSNLSCDSNIDSSKLVLSWENREYNISEYCNNCECLIENRELILDEEHIKMVDWNLHEVDMHLHLLKSKLLRYKIYLSSKNPPFPYEKINK